MKARYGIKALVFLARTDGLRPVAAQSIAKAERIPPKYLEGILRALRQAGYVASVRGQFGGYALQRPAGEVVLGDVIRALSGPLAPVPCLSKTAYERCGECVDEATCAVRMLLQDVHAATLRIVDGTTLADLAARGRDDQP
jgi:Rrf2 family protein